MATGACDAISVELRIRAGNGNRPLTAFGQQAAGRKGHRVLKWHSTFPRRGYGYQPSGKRVFERRPGLGLRELLVP